MNPKTKTQLYGVKLSTFKKEYQYKGINLIGREDYENQTNIKVPLYIKGNIRVQNEIVLVPGPLAPLPSPKREKELTVSLQPHSLFVFCFLPKKTAAI